MRRRWQRASAASTALAKFNPYIAGKELTLADCAAFMHLPLVSVATKLVYGRDFLEDMPQVKAYIKTLGERPAFKRVNDDRKAAQAALGEVSAFQEYLRFFVTLTAVLDPFLAVPIFLAVTSSHSSQSRVGLVRVVSITVFAVLAATALLGDTILNLVGASLAAFRVGGGLVLLLMALAMLNAQAGGLRQSEEEAAELESGELKGVVPLAVPLLAGPGAISTTIIAAEKGGGSAAHLAAIIGVHLPRQPAHLGRAARGERDRQPAGHHRPQHRHAPAGPAAGRARHPDDGRGAEGAVLPASP